MIDEHPVAGVEMGPEEEIWEGRTSQWVNLPWFALCLLVLPIPYAVYRYLRVATTVYTLTNQRLLWRYGILNRRTEEIELYRVRDTGLYQPLLQRLLGLGTVEVVSTDLRTPTIVMPALHDAGPVREHLRRATEKMRRLRGVRDIDVT